MLPWRQIKATAATLPVLVAAALYVLPAEGRASPVIGSGAQYHRLVHGWPLTFASRYFNDFLPARQSYAWSIGESLEWWSTPALLFDAALVGLLCGLVWYVSFRFSCDQRPTFRFSLRGVLIGVVLCAICSHWVAQRVRWYLAEQQLRTYGLEVGRSGIDSIWLRELLGDEASQLLCEPEELRELTADRLQKIDLRPVRLLPTLRLIEIQNQSITDADIAHLVACRRLELCYLRHARVTDEGVRLLAQLPKLRYLDLSGSNVTDNAVDDLLRMEHLECLRLCGTQLTAAGVERLDAGLPADCRLVRGRLCTMFGYTDLPDPREAKTSSAP